ncbi:MAG: sodium-dependent transporter [Myxococcota bacterium]|jgi:NSS family neurotransmitter:Na+ symporter|nr:sodium-dependent transporter [Myxococcota bacterium]
MANNRGQWGSRLGFVLAASGSAVGLGNLWKFPYLSWKNDGGAFVIAYIFAVLLLGLPIMMAEILIGKKAQESPVPAFEKLGGKAWSLVGWLGVAAGAVILAYYTVIAGWSLRSFFQCVLWSVEGYTAPGPNDFGVFLGNGALQIGLTFVFTILTSVIVYRGIGGGIERASKIMMPVLYLILLYLVGTALLMPGRDEALRHLFVPHFSKMTTTTALEAMGQAFFSMSLGLGAMITYGSYMKKDESVFRSSLWVLIADTSVAILAAIAMFSIIHSVPSLVQKMEANELNAVGMLFVTLPALFYTTMPGGVVVGPLFYVLVAFAALTSTISLGEVVASLLIDRKGWSRSKATLVSASAVFGGSVLCALSLGAVEPLSTIELFAGKQGVLSNLDHLAANWMLPLGGLGITIFVGWFLGKKACQEELGLQKATAAFTAWLWIVRVLAPLVIFIMLAAILSGKDFS